ncbi:MAG TPA: RNA chaperone Hfq [Nitrospirota bacterium]|nr:RNA chaperone Hfq [Nitrospirota bacterium]
METNLLDRMLNAYLAEQTPVTVTLQNKIRVSGKVKAFDSYVIVVEGQKREILYRHAVSSLALAVQEEQKRQSVPAGPASAKTAARSQKSAAHKPRPAQNSTPLSLSPAEQSINNGMKEGLLKWMQEQKATQ